MVSITDVAKHAHVSKMTVSRVLNHPEKVSPSIKADVLAAIDELGYVQNRAGRSLATKRNYAIAFVMLDQMDQVEPYFGNLILYIADELQRKGYTMSLHRSLDDSYENMDGLLISGARPHDIAAIQQLSLPSVSYGNHPDINSVDIDNIAGTALATDELISHTYDEYLYLDLDMPDTFANDRKQGFLDHIGAQPHTIITLANDEHLAFDAVSTVLKEHHNIGIVASTDRLALGALRAVKQAKLVIPNDVGIIGFDGIFIHKLAEQELSTIVQPLAGIAQEMVNLLLEQLDTPLDSTISRAVPPYFSQGQTS
ncbi:LacI family transcriptional regulator [Weissella ceti]|uniref:LacI family transcriptional regulator n=1 Tax=Weissella ceti TaxID=759620 RepID=A0ABT3E4T6_9LACO|nr:LacI family DNA-binding transcriptional regulator [Weissella ceti]MCW0952897.1 LacI family transcriptional regulator [Weissella ceti]QVK11444.1 LacI family DNA-binding transcriptional regulator [Weissella ceti]